MQTWQKGEITHPITDGNLALASDSLRFIQTPKVKKQLSLVRKDIVKKDIYDPQVEAFSEPKMIMTVIAMTAGLCLLWCLVVFTLYQIARFAL